VLHGAILDSKIAGDTIKEPKVNRKLEYGLDDDGLPHLTGNKATSFPAVTIQIEKEEKEIEIQEK